MHALVMTVLLASQAHVTVYKPPCDTPAVVVCDVPNLQRALVLASQWLPMDDSTGTNGTLLMYNGSHITYTMSYGERNTAAKSKRAEAEDLQRKAATLNREATDLDFIEEVMRVCGVWK